MLIRAGPLFIKSGPREWEISLFTHVYVEQITNIKNLALIKTNKPLDLLHFLRNEDYNQAISDETEGPKWVTSIHFLSLGFLSLRQLFLNS